MATRGQRGVGERETLHGIVMPARADFSQLAILKLKLSKFIELADNLDKRFSESLLTVTLGFGEHALRVLSEVSAPQVSLPPRVPPQVAEKLALEPSDLVVLIRSDRYDSCFVAARVLAKWLATNVEFLRSFTVFHYLDHRNLYGFKCWRDKVVGAARQQLLFMDDEQQPTWHHGSFLILQCNQIHERRWQQLGDKAQEQVMGFRKLDGKPLTEASSIARTHAAVARPGLGTALCWQQLPIANVSEQAHLELLWGHDFAAITNWLTNRFIATDDSPQDPLLAYEYNLLTAAYFIPPRVWFERLTQVSSSR